jgi:hypothetical protein
VLGSLADNLAQQQLRMSVDTRVQPEADGPADSLGHFALVDRPQPRLEATLYAAVGSDKLGDDGEILHKRSAFRTYK